MKMMSLIKNYGIVDGVNVARAGMTSVSMFQFGQNSIAHSTMVMEGVWSTNEVDFNIKGLSIDCFLPSKFEKRGQKVWLSNKIWCASSWIGASKVAAIDLDKEDHVNFNSTSDNDDEM